MLTSNSPVLSTQLLRIQPIAAHVPLSEAQQRFNQLLTQLEQARSHWQAWQHATQEVRTRYARLVRPQWDLLWQAQTQLAQWLDAHSADALSKQDRQTLKAMIVQLSEAGAEQASDPGVRARCAELYARYAAAAPQPQALPEDEPIASPVADVQATSPGSVPECEVDWEDPEAVAAYVEAQTRAAQAQAERARAQHQQQRQRAQAQRKAQAQQSSGQPSVRAVYRQLASRLHPDREQDPQERERKTALMQRVNQAYEAEDLLALLELQWEVEQLRPQGLAQLQDAHLQRYNVVLAEQLQQLQQAALACEKELLQMLGLPAGRRYAAHKMPAMLRPYVQSLQQQVAQLQQALHQLQHQPQHLSDWLRAQR